MTVGPTGRRDRRVVVGYDGSDVSRAAVSWAAEQARSNGRLYVIDSRPLGKGVDEHAVLANLHIQAGEVLADLDWVFEVPREIRPECSLPLPIDTTPMRSWSA